MFSSIDLDISNILMRKEKEKLMSLIDDILVETSTKPIQKTCSIVAQSILVRECDGGKLEK